MGRNWGGKRAGAGRPPTGRGRAVRRLLYLPPAFAEDIETVAAANDMAVAVVARNLLMVAIGTEVPLMPTRLRSLAPMTRLQVYLPREVDDKINEMARERSLTRGVMLRHLVVHALMTVPGKEVKS